MAALVALAVLAVACGAGTDRVAVEEGSIGPPAPSPTDPGPPTAEPTDPGPPTAEPTDRDAIATEPAEPDIGPPIQPDALPPLPDEGVAVEVGDDLVLAGLDGTVHGHLPGTGLATVRGLQHVPAGLVPLAHDGRQAGWLDAAAGAFSPADAGVPLVGGAAAVVDPQAGATAAYAVVGHGEQLAGWDRDARWWLSRGHRTVSWEECPEDTTGGCPVHGHDLDMGGELELGPGCWVADTLGDFAQLLVCNRPDAAPRSWLEAVEPGGDPRRYVLPRPEGMPSDVPTSGHFRSAELGDGWILAQVSMECEVPAVALIEHGTGELQPIAGEDEPLTVAALALGWTGDGRAAVLVHDSPCAQDSAAPGVWSIDPAGGDGEPVYRLPAGAPARAHLWRDVPGVDLRAP